MAGASHPPAVVLGLSPTGLHVARALGRAGVPVTGVAESRQPGAASRYVTDTIVDPDPLGRLERLCDRFEPMPADGRLRPVVIPSSDQDVAWVIEHQERLAGHFSFQPSYCDGVAARIMDKESFYDLCDQRGVAYPRIWRGTVDELPSLRDEMSYPCMIKPALIHEVKAEMAGRKGWLVRSREELDRVLPEMPRGAGTMLCQEVVAGPESSITLYCAYVGTDGRFHQPFTARKLRQYPPGFGSASQVQSHPEPESLRLTEELLRKLGYRGVVAAEFKPDPETGQLKIIEINVRPSLWFGITSAAGKHPVLAAYRELSGVGEMPGEVPQADGVRWRYSLKDAVSARFYRRNPGFILPAPDPSVTGASRGAVGAVFAQDDPLPAAADMLNLATKFVRRGTSD